MEQRKRLWATLALGLLGAAALALPGCSSHGSTAEAQTTAGKPAAAPSPERESLAVAVEEVTVWPVQREVQFVGNFQGFDETTVTAEVSGRVVEVLHDVGDVVRPGEVLLRLDPTDYQLQVEETRRALELEASRIGLPIPADKDFVPEKIMPIVHSLDLRKLPTVLRAIEQEENARRRAERAQRLRQQNIISEEASDEAATAYEVARTTRVQSEMDAQSVVAGIKHRLVLLEISMEKLRRTAVVVPTPTRREGLPEPVEYAVAQRKIEEGEMVKDAPGSSSATFDLVIDKVLKLVATAPEKYMGEVKKGQEVQLRDVEAYPGRLFKGIVTRVSPVVDRLKHSFEIEALVPNPDRLLKPGGYAKGVILTREDPKAVLVPGAAVATFVGSTKVFVVRDGKAHAVPVNPGVEVVISEKQLAARRGSRGARQGPSDERRAWVELVEPDPVQLRPGTPVIVTNPAQLAEGTPVVVRAEAPKGDQVPAANDTGPPKPH